jgi:hypothetical protein
MTDDKPDVIRENESSKKYRMLNLDITGSKFEHIEGGLMVKDVLALDEGTWTDSNVGTPLYYTPKALSESVTNWKMNGFWARHAGGSPRNITDKVGRVLNPRFLNTGMFVDIFLPKRSQQSKDVADMIESGEINAVSIEHGGEESYNKNLDRWETKSLTYYGLAAVDRGACETCVIRKQSVSELTVDLVPLANEPVVEQVVETISELKESVEMDEELKKALSDFDIRLKAIEGSFSDAKAKSEKEMSEKAEQVKLLGEMAEKIKMLEKEPTQKSLAAEDVPMRVKTDCDLLPKN